MDTAQAKEKILKYCAYQERSQKEVKNKLYTFGISTDQVNELMLYLVQENYLNEERFALHFSASKMRQKKWGRKKIEQELKKKGVSEKLVFKGLKALNKSRYDTNLVEVLEKKDRNISYSSAYERKQKLIRYLLGRGYLWAEIEVALEDFLSEE